MYGTAERNLKMIREALGVNVSARDDTVRLRGDGHAVDAAKRVIDRLIEASDRERPLSNKQVLDAIAEAGWRNGSPENGEAGVGEAAGGAVRWSERMNVYSGGRPVAPKSPNQAAYLRAIEEHDLVFGIGPAGTGKTYLAVAAAVQLLRAGRVKKAILARPAVEAGERLGFLPGDQFAKVNPYLRPLFDALHDMMDYGTIKRFMASDVLEVVPLAYMRGRTLNDAVIILDEAQNSTRGQMQMFLTRMGQRSKMIVTGDPTQIDLPEPKESGLFDALKRL
ncbi:MAG TPA: PhoH family protein, partial [Phycisphaerales bacterium]|nr:PhoH family protein [Phycisphaerales bacterium]